MILDNISGWMGSILLLNIFWAIVLLVIGVFLGKFVSYILSRIVKGTDIEKEIRPSFVRLIITVIQWSIYIIFINLALSKFSIEGLSDIISDILIVVPALTGSLVLIGVGFAVAIYLREVIEDSEITGWETLSQYLYYFVLYVFGVYALNLALVIMNEFIKNILILALTIIIGSAVAFISVKKEIGKH